jgi:hypothetical protein
MQLFYFSKAPQTKQKWIKNHKWIKSRGALGCFKKVTQTTNAMLDIPIIYLKKIFFSAPIQKECLNMVTKYTDEIIAMFVAEYTPEQVCAQLGLCKSSQVRIF